MCKMCSHEVLSNDIKYMRKEFDEYKKNGQAFRTKMDKYMKDDQDVKRQILIRLESFITKEEADKKYISKKESRILIISLWVLSTVLGIVATITSFTK